MTSHQIQGTTQHPEWSKNACMYQINFRQFTPEGNIRAAISQLARIKELNVDLLYVMPVQPIGVLNRKGELGSPYSIRDYLAVSDEMGTMLDFQQFVRAAHDLGMHVILDWVANHCAWDNNLIEAHPDWFDRDSKGVLRPPLWLDWDDTVSLNYGSVELRQYMRDAMLFWVRETDIDGFRCDVAGYVPLDFWADVRAALTAIKPVFMLAEWDTRDMHTSDAFDASYSTTFFKSLLRSTRRCSARPLGKWLADTERSYPHDAMRMTYVENHDVNSWKGTEFELFGDAVRLAIVSTVIAGGIPLMYNGQEAGCDKRLRFFERDPIVWRGHPHGALYRDLFALKHAHPALWNAPWGARPEPMPVGGDAAVLAFVRANERDAVVGVFNFSSVRREVRLGAGPCRGRFREVLGGAAEVVLGEDGRTETLVPLGPWECRVFVKGEPSL